MPTEHSKIPVLVVLFLGITSLVLSIGILILADNGKTPDAALYTLAGSAIGALGSLLSNTQNRPGQRVSDEAVTVKTAPDKPLETIPAENHDDLGAYAPGMPQEPK